MKIQNDYNFKRVSMNLPVSLVEKVNIQVEKGNYLNFSEFTREAIRIRLEKIENNEKENNKDNIFLNR